MDNSTPSFEPRFPTWVDSTALASFKACEKRGFWSQVLRLTTEAPNPHFRAGGAYATAQEITRDYIYGPSRLSTEEAVARGLLHLIKEYGDFEPSDDLPDSARAKTWMGMSDAFIRYYDRWSPEFDWILPDMQPSEDAHPRPSTEFSFAVPLPIEHPETGDPILFTGRADMKVRLGGSGCWHHFSSQDDMDLLRSWPLYIFDDKTTWQMGKTWAQQWTYRGQFIGYCWANNQITLNPWERAVGAVVCGAGIQKTQTKTDRAIVDYPQWKIDDWYDSTCYHLERMVRCWKTNKWAKQWDDSCTMYGGCDFAPLCDTPHPTRWMHNFVESTWNPVPAPTKES